MSRIPTLFVGHGSPMVALEHSDTTRAWAAGAAARFLGAARPS